MKHLLQVDNLSVSFNVDASTIKAVRNVSYYIDQGRPSVLWGEWFWQKREPTGHFTAAPSSSATIDSGRVLLEGEDLLQYEPHDAKMREVRGGRISMIFQEPMTSLNPVKRIGDQIMESIVIHGVSAETRLGSMPLTC